jgi:hypothetical protein
MGLTLHYRLTAPEGCTARSAAALVRRLHATAGAWAAEGRIAGVHEISSERADIGRYGSAWRAVPHPDDPETSVGVLIPPEAGWIFPVELGEDCEWLWLGLCRYPATVAMDGRERATRLGPRWQFAHFCKTQYAGLHGWENFVRCHVGAVDLLGVGRGLGLRVRIEDEGGYWPGRKLAMLRRHLDQMNGIVAAFAGAMKDATGDDDRAPVQSPIFAHPQFERLEAEGAARAGASLAEATKIIARAAKP